MLTEFFNILESENLMSAREAFVISFIITSLITLVGFVIKAIAIFIMAKNKGLKNKWLAFIPFLNYVLLGKIVGPVRSFGVRMKNVGLWMAIVAFLLELITQLLNLGYYFSVIEIISGVSITPSTAFGIDWFNGVGILFFIVKGIAYLLSFAEILVYVSLVFAVFKKYASERMLIYSLVSVFFDFFFGIILLLVANKKPVDYDSYIRRVREEQMRNYYGYSYRNPYNNQKNSEEDPFPEYSNKKTSENENRDKSNDDFFN